LNFEVGPGFFFFPPGTKTRVVCFPRARATPKRPRSALLATTAAEFFLCVARPLAGESRGNNRSPLHFHLARGSFSATQRLHPSPPEAGIRAPNAGIGLRPNNVLPLLAPHPPFGAVQPSLLFRRFPSLFVAKIPPIFFFFTSPLQFGFGRDRFSPPLPRFYLRRHSNGLRERRPVYSLPPR